MALSAGGFFCGQIACPGDETEVIEYSSQTNNLQAISYGVLISDIFFLNVSLARICEQEYEADPTDSLTALRPFLFRLRNILFSSCFLPVTCWFSKRFRLVRGRQVAEHHGFGTPA